MNNSKSAKFVEEGHGFSLVELIVVIAIMAVLVAVLAPALLQYVERSRAQKDDSAMGEVTNAIQLALADQNAYDEALKQVITGKNGTWAKSCYVDSGSPDDGHKVNTKGTDQYIYNDAERKADEVPYQLNGQMRGLTITFSPSKIGSSNKKQFVLADGVINSDSNKTLDELNADGSDTTMQGQIYNKLRAAVGDTIPVTSQTYRNSDYTVFIRMGTTGGNSSDAQDAIKVYGQWGGTNLNEGASQSGNGGSGSGSGNSGQQSGGTETPDPEVTSFDYTMPADASGLASFEIDIGSITSDPDSIITFYKIGNAVPAALFDGSTVEITIQNIGDATFHLNEENISTFETEFGTSASSFVMQGTNCEFAGLLIDNGAMLPLCINSLVPNSTLNIDIGGGNMFNFTCPDAGLYAVNSRIPGMGLNLSLTEIKNLGT